MIRREQFVEAFVTNFNASEAARKIGASTKSSRVTGHRMMEDPAVQVMIQQRLKKRSKRYEATLDRLVREYSTIAFSDIGDYVDWEPGNVSIKSKKDITRRARRAVAEIKETFHAEGGANITVKMHDKMKALDSLGRYLGMFEEGGQRDEDGRPSGANADTDVWTTEIIGADAVTADTRREWMDKYLNKPKSSTGG